MQSQVLVWPGGEHAFRLRLGDLEGLQQKTDCGPEFLLHKINLGQWAAADLFEVIRFGLIGGGMAAEAAQRLVRDSFDRHPLIDFKVPAQAVLCASLYGPPDDPVGENGPVNPTPESQQKTVDGGSVGSTA